MKQVFELTKLHLKVSNIVRRKGKPFKGAFSKGGGLIGHISAGVLFKSCILSRFFLMLAI